MNIIENTIRSDSKISSTVSYSHSSTIDLLRCIAIFEVVLFHWNTNGYSPVLGLPFLTLISYFFVLGKRDLGEFSDLAKLRMRRLMIPWIFWSVFYLLVAFVRGSWGENRSFITEHDYWQILIGGGEVHLWFLPMLFCSSCGLFFIRKASDSWKLTTGLVFGALGFIASFVILRVTNPDVWPIKQYISVVPLFFLGFVLVRIRSSGIMNVRNHSYKYNLAVFMIITAVVSIFYIAYRINFIGIFQIGGTSFTRYLFVGTVLLFSVQYKFPKYKFLDFLAGRMYGVYLVHIFVELLVKRFFYIADIDINGAPIVFAFSVLVAYTLSKIKFFRLFV